MKYTLFFKNTSFYNELYAVLFFQKHQFLQWIMLFFFQKHKFYRDFYHFETFLAPGGVNGGAKPSRAELEPSRAEPSRTEPSRAGPSRAGPGRAGPDRAEPSRAERRRGSPRKHGQAKSHTPTTDDRRRPTTADNFAPPGRGSTTQKNTHLDKSPTAMYVYIYIYIYVRVPK